MILLIHSPVYRVLTVLAWASDVFVRSLELQMSSGFWMDVFRGSLTMISGLISQRKRKMGSRAASTFCSNSLSECFTIAMQDMWWWGDDMTSWVHLLFRVHTPWSFFIFLWSGVEKESERASVNEYACNATAIMQLLLSLISESNHN